MRDDPGAQGDCLPRTSGSPLVLVNPEELARQVREIVRKELDARGASATAEWVNQRAAAELAGVGVSTVRAWQAAGKLARGRRSRVNVQQLREYLASSGRPAPAAAPTDLGRERARRAAAEILGKGRP